MADPVFYDGTKSEAERWRDSAGNTADQPTNNTWDKRLAKWRMPNGAVLDPQPPPPAPVAATPPPATPAAAPAAAPAAPPPQPRAAAAQPVPAPQPAPATVSAPPGSTINIHFGGWGGQPQQPPAPPVAAPPVAQPPPRRNAWVGWLLGILIVLAAIGLVVFGINRGWFNFLTAPGPSASAITSGLPAPNSNPEPATATASAGGVSASASAAPAASAGDQLCLTAGQGEQQICPFTPPPVPPVVQEDEPAATCDLDCWKIRLATTCPNSSFNFEGPLVGGMTAEQLIVLHQESMDCPPAIIPPIPYPRPEYIPAEEPPVIRVADPQPAPPPAPPVVEVQANMPDGYCNVCEMFNEGQGRSSRTVSASQRISQEPAVQVSSGTVCMWALNRAPTAMVLHDGPGPASPQSHGLIRWDQDPAAWQPSRYYPGFYTRQICFSASLLTGRSVVSLCGDVGYQNFRRDDGVISQIVNAGSSPENDPACIAGSACPSHLR